jgi:hypothetical protein
MGPAGGAEAMDEGVPWFEGVVAIWEIAADARV